MPYFNSSLYDFENPQPSWWEASTKSQDNSRGDALRGDENCEVAIIGGGYTGLSAALHLARDFHIDVRVLEAGKIGWGSSGRNGGFCCMGGTMHDVSALIRKFGVEETKAFYAAQTEAVELVRDIAGSEKIDFNEVGECELVVAEKTGHFKALARECEIFRGQLGVDARMMSKEEFREIHYDAPHQQGAFAIAPGFGLHPLKYCIGIARAAERHGAILHPGSEVTSWEKADGKHILRTAQGSIQAKHVIVACNGFMPEHLNQSLRNRILPLQSNIIVTKPLTKDQLAAHGWKTYTPAVNSRNVYNYYRMLPGNRLLMGGRGDYHGTPQGAVATSQLLKEQISRLWPEWNDLEIDYSWRGFVCFTSRLRPAIGRLPDDPTVSMAYGYHGNGVNNATWMGRELAKWLVQGNDRHATVPNHLPAIMRGVSQKFPFAFLRRQYTRAGIGWHRFKDVLDR